MTIVVGGGGMGEAVIAGPRPRSASPAVHVVEKRVDRATELETRYAVSTSSDLPSRATRHRPPCRQNQDVDAVARAIAPHLASEAVVVRCRRCDDGLLAERPRMRRRPAMPNTPALVGEGMAAEPRRGAAMPVGRSGARRAGGLRKVIEVPESHQTWSPPCPGRGRPISISRIAPSRPPVSSSAWRPRDLVADAGRRGDAARDRRTGSVARAGDQPWAEPRPRRYKAPDARAVRAAIVGVRWRRRPHARPSWAAGSSPARHTGRVVGHHVGGHMSDPMTDIWVRALTEDEWDTFRTIRLAALTESPDAFVADAATEWTMTRSSGGCVCAAASSVCRGRRGRRPGSPVSDSSTAPRTPQRSSVSTAWRGRSVAAMLVRRASEEAVEDGFEGSPTG